MLKPLSPVEAMELLLDKMGKTKSNAEFLVGDAEDGLSDLVEGEAVLGPARRSYSDRSAIVGSTFAARRAGM